MFDVEVLGVLCPCYSLTLTFPAKLTARIVVAPDYPTVAPVFAVCVKWQSDRSALNDFHIQVSVVVAKIFICKSSLFILQ